MPDASSPIRRDPFADVFRSYEASRARVAGRPDSQARAPGVFAACWRALGCVPAAQRTVLVTGSKGKGSTARMVAWNLQRAGHRVGLVVSPEEVCHFDRIRIDNQPIPAAAFQERLARAMPLLDDELAARAPDRYLSPTGIFLTVALQWFADEAVDWVVLEGGRGVQWDEIGQLAARVAVVTSVLDEHVAALGGTPGNVLRDKLSIARCAPVTVVDPDVAQAAADAGLQVPGLRIAAPSPAAAAVAAPAWYARLCALAATVVRELGHAPAFQPFSTPSFAWFGLAGTAVLCEPVIHARSIDAGFLRTRLPAGSRVLVGLSDDKDVAGVLDGLRRCGLGEIGAIALTSRADHVRSGWLQTRAGTVARLGTLDVVEPDLPALRAAVRAFAAGAPALYVVGVQVFLRCLRQAFSPQLAGPAAVESAS
ncbi:MAG TPA: hypothetical protein VFE82_11495 [Ramlibacter sp.]|jgi:dihydrofolate synthase/folylpolyglutamate synthase|uniref:hypothetical protein n=1 Tax=Ramlibacter sp. TaxID=1917967 RepID=UPI002D3C46E5|nr:hypothetical protein [Ramlibacter sp.]HZY19098.1 hypothetical protein [Ramlibacter sp.]